MKIPSIQSMLDGAHGNHQTPVSYTHLPPLITNHSYIIAERLFDVNRVTYLLKLTKKSILLI